LIRQVSSPVRWEDVVRRLVADGARTFVELGPGTVLSGLIRKIEPAAAAVSIENVKGLEKALALLRTPA
jgi:[acyl-carrier-protein] S-malonyltransferase